MTGQVAECNEKLKDNEEAYYKCMWSDCKVYNMASSSMSWLEKHVPTHGGKFSYPCIVSGCKMRFSSQVSLRLLRYQMQNDVQYKQVLLFYKELY